MIDSEWKFQQFVFKCSIYIVQNMPGYCYRWNWDLHWSRSWQSVRAHREQRRSQIINRWAGSYLHFVFKYDEVRRVGIPGIHIIKSSHLFWRLPFIILSLHLRLRGGRWWRRAPGKGGQTRMLTTTIDCQSASQRGEDADC